LRQAAKILIEMQCSRFRRHATCSATDTSEINRQERAMPSRDEVPETFRFADDDDDDLGGYGGGSRSRRSRYDEDDDDEGGWSINSDNSDQLWDSAEDVDEDDEDAVEGDAVATEDEEPDLFPTSAAQNMGIEDLEDDETGPLVRAPGRRGRPKGSGKKNTSAGGTSIFESFGAGLPTPPKGAVPAVDIDDDDEIEDDDDEIEDDDLEITEVIVIAPTGRGGQGGARKGASAPAPKAPVTAKGASHEGGAKHSAKAVSKPSKPATKAAAKTAAKTAAKPASKKAAKPAAKSQSKSASRSGARKAPAKKPVAKKATSVKKKTASKPASKSAAHKPAVRKASTAAKKSSSSRPAVKKSVGHKSARKAGRSASHSAGRSRR
jgi:hypothetical protein